MVCFYAARHTRARAHVSFSTASGTASLPYFCGPRHAWMCNLTESVQWEMNKSVFIMRLRTCESPGERVPSLARSRDREKASSPKKKKMMKLHENIPGERAGSHRGCWTRARSSYRINDVNASFRGVLAITADAQSWPFLARSGRIAGNVSHVASVRDHVNESLSNLRGRAKAPRDEARNNKDANPPRTAVSNSRQFAESRKNSTFNSAMKRKRQ